jgi:threonyl-tRNA synthetase
MELEVLRHSAAHIMAAAVKKLYPQAKFGIGPAIEDGFYYDFELPQPISEKDLGKIEERMRQIVNEKHSFVQEKWPKDKARAFFKENKQDYKLELLEQIEDKQVSVYKLNDFVDLCRGPHVNSSTQIKHFKLLSISGAYWRGDERNQQLLRIYGTAFDSKKELKKYLQLLQQAKQRDHRVLGKKLDLFNIYHDQAGAGLVFYLPQGALLRRIIEDWEIGEHLARGYQMVTTPHIMNKQLWQQSGHADYYKQYMYTIRKENQDFALKPMNCPGHILIYKSKLHSWRDLPLRLFELGTVYRHEKSGVLHGLLRGRGFTQDDAHIFCRPDDLESEISGVLDFIQEAMHKFGFEDFKAELSTRPDEYIGDKQQWDRAEEILEDVLKKKKFAYQINQGEGAFYGPKIDVNLRDSLKRQWQCATVQLDYNIPKRFNLTYRDPQGEDTRVIMIHRVVLGSLERFMATLIEHYAGNFPLWLAPTQVVVLNINDAVVDYARKVQEKLRAHGFRVRIDSREQTLQKRIRENELQKVPFLVIVGNREQQQNKIAPRRHGGHNLGAMGIEEFCSLLKEEVDN